ncbi:hypothetical protein [Falsiroseomonas sp.]|uniref:hypothetical protein n=1 Tax=Falsiroseomonas sp. TaxID=2870721 RepID=UPI0027364F6B|nr:hypothetical protein [Falsiroseomonas sp.]MDP3418463.1 hypothetical protein [Falsiroseomonas sp.]
MPDGFDDGRATPERLLVAALRAGMAPGGSQRDCLGILAQAGIRPAGVLGFGLLLSVLARGARRKLEVAPGAGAALSGDEAMLLELVAALQRGDALSAIGGLSEWLEPDNLAAALRGAQILARQMAAAGLAVRDSAGPSSTRLAAPRRSR